METDQKKYEVTPVGEERYVATCLDGSCTGYRSSKKGSPGKAETAVRDHGRDKHGWA